MTQDIGTPQGPAEEGAVLLLVLIALALVAALAGIALRLDRAGLSGLRAEAVLFNRTLAEQSALAVVASRLGPAPSLPRDGTPVMLTVEGEGVQVSIRAAEGLVNPAHARLPILRALFQAKGASPDQALDLARRVLAARIAGHMAGPRDFALVLSGDPGLWRRVAPDITFLGAAATVNASAAPPDLRAALAGIAEAGVDLTQAPPQRGLYEIDVALILPDGLPGPVSRHSVLQDRSLRLHPVAQSWPMEFAPQTDIAP